MQSYQKQMARHAAFTHQCDNLAEARLQVTGPNNNNNLGHWLLGWFVLGCVVALFPLAAGCTFLPPTLRRQVVLKYNH